ncbi:DUF1381 domain-containing protein, partial [Staphylococcus sp. 231237_7MaSpsaltlick]|uniref:DUF1381 domain-containing protein n=1 Tax=Staphylococcus sp. 231237_7MaSpsaltlick TaxID=3367518 RepID=UPI00370A258F
DSTGHPFTHVTKARENETFTVVEAESKEEAERKYNDLIQCANCGSWDTEYEYLYVNNIPIHLAFSCNNCNERYGKELVRDEKGYSIKLKEKDSE